MQILSAQHSTRHTGLITCRMAGRHLVSPLSPPLDREPHDGGVRAWPCLPGSQSGVGHTRGAQVHVCWLNEQRPLQSFCRPQHVGTAKGRMSHRAEAKRRKPSSLSGGSMRTPGSQQVLWFTSCSLRTWAGHGQGAWQDSQVFQEKQEEPGAVAQGY